MSYCPGVLQGLITAEGGGRIAEEGTPETHRETGFKGHYVYGSREDFLNLFRQVCIDGK